MFKKQKMEYIKYDSIQSLMNSEISLNKDLMNQEHLGEKLESFCDFGEIQKGNDGVFGDVGDQEMKV